ncbi:cysteine hydrolase family protein [Pararhizobium sp.]|uniref:cysteine hydrolase family protein n=1 Tax=Pararhizobium sp. TaxID=1977563 RepID=UPI00271AA9DC|nr:cysteine hydrolase family protein [Pararhizobium sp.]MDO9417681.1 cysteine hydrolase family protein [Pararhizobium sp.]
MTTALLIIDVQNAVLEGEGTPDRQPAIDAAFTETTLRLRSVQERARAADIPVIFVQHDSGRGDTLARPSQGWELRLEIRPLPGETVVHKTSCDSFFHTALQDELQKRAITHLVIGGCQTPYCVDTTARRAVSLGYGVTLLSDGHMTGDRGALTFTQIIAHHNAVLGGFNAGSHVVELRRCDEITF